MELNRNEQKTIYHAIDHWVAEGRITEEKAQELRDSAIAKDDACGQIARYFFIIAISCILLAFASIFIDEKFLEKIRRYFALSNIVIALLAAIVAFVWFRYIYRRRHRFSGMAYEVYMILGALATLTAIVYVCKDTGFGAKYTAFLIISSAVLFVLGVVLHSRALWVGGLLAIMGWYGAFTELYSQQDLFLGMNYPVRFTVFGVLVLLLSFVQGRIKKLEFTKHITYVIGMLIFFTGFWGISIFGNYAHFEEWMQVRQTQVLWYALLFALAAGTSLFAGIRNRDDVARDFGIVFLLANLYTRYFEYFWDSMNKGLFFLVLAVSFWLLGRWIEKNKKAQKQENKS